MSRDIKFRAWIDMYRKMYDVLQLQSPFSDEGFYRVFINKAYREGQPMNYRISGKNALMQYTGLKDKNGKEVYEGDLLGGIYKDGFVAYCEKCKQFQLKFNEFGCMACECDIHWSDLVDSAYSELEVTGNIYENRLN